MLSSETLSFLSFVVYIAANIPYIRAILKKQTQPAKASWLIWAVLDGITITGMYLEHAVNGLVIAATLGSWTIAILSLKYGTPGWTKLDKFCLSGAIAGLLAWWISHNPVYGVAISLAVMFLGSIPTFVSAWADPTREDKTAWSISWTSGVLAIAAIPVWTLINVAQPLTLFVIQSMIVFIVYVRPTMLKKTTT